VHYFCARIVARISYTVILSLRPSVLVLRLSTVPRPDEIETLTIL